MAFQAALNDDWGKSEFLLQILAGSHKALDRFGRFDCLIFWDVDSQKAVHGQSNHRFADSGDARGR